MSQFRTHYDNLQVKEDASPEVIKGAYRYLSQKWHPDKNIHNRDEAERVLKIINNAYATLSDPVKRKAHDEWIKRQRDSSQSASSPPPPPPPPGPPPCSAPSQGRSEDHTFGGKTLWEWVLTLIALILVSKVMGLAGGVGALVVYFLLEERIGKILALLSGIVVGVVVWLGVAILISESVEGSAPQAASPTYSTEPLSHSVQEVQPTPAAPVATQTGVPKFKDYTVGSMYTGPRAPVKLTTEFDNTFRTRIRNTQNQPVNFAGEYVLSYWGCGSNCLMGVSVNARTGAVVELPGTVCCWNGDGEKILFQSDSRLVVLAGMIDEAGVHGAHFYELLEGRFQNVVSIPVTQGVEEKTPSTDMAGVVPDFNQFMKRERVTYSSEGNPKSKGLKVTFDYPASWKGVAGVRPHVLTQATSKNGAGLELCNLLIMSLPIVDGSTLTDEDIEDVFSEEGIQSFVPKGAKFVESGRTTIDGLPSAWIVIDMESSRAGIPAVMRFISFNTFYRNELIQLSCGVGDGLESSLYERQRHFTSYLPVFQQIANSLVIHNRWN